MTNAGFARRDTNGLPYYSCLAFEELGIVCHGFSTRRGGVSRLPANALNLSYLSCDSDGNVAENRRRFLAALSLEGADLATLSQVHSDRLHLLDGIPAMGPGRPQADSIGTRLEQTAIAVQVADCFPLLLVDPRRRVIAAVHAGWRGILARIVSKTVAGLVSEFQTDPPDLMVAVGPGIRSCCFEVGPEVRDQFASSYPRIEPASPHPVNRGKYLLDLPRALQIQFRESGLEGERVFDMGACTACNTEEFFSYRREGKHSGRMMAVIALKPVPDHDKR